MSIDPENPLGPLSHGDTPPIDAALRDRIESGLRVQHASLPSGRPPNRRSVPRWLVVGPVVAVLLLVATIGLVLRDEAAVAALELRDAQNVTVTLADGEVVVDPGDGFALPDGAIVVVGDAGRVTIDEVTLSAGAVVTVRDGQLVTDVVATTTTARPVVPPGEPSTTTPPADGRTTTTTTTTISPGDTRPPADRPSDTVPGDLAPVDTAGPAPSVPPAPEPPDDGVDDRDDVGTDISVALRINARDGGVFVAWHTEGVVHENWRVVVVRTTDGSEPTGPATGVVIAEGDRGDILERRGDLPADIEALGYRVVVLDEGEGVVASSVVQTLTPP